MTGGGLDPSNVHAFFVNTKAAPDSPMYTFQPPPEGLHRSMTFQHGCHHHWKPPGGMYFYNMSIMDNMWMERFGYQALLVCYIPQVWFSLEERLLQFLKQTICNSSLGLSFFVGIKSFYCSMFTSQHKVHQVHKSTRYFHQSHTIFPQFIHLLNSIYPKQMLHVFLQDILEYH